MTDIPKMTGDLTHSVVSALGGDKLGGVVAKKATEAASDGIEKAKKKASEKIENKTVSWVEKFVTDGRHLADELPGANLRRVAHEWLTQVDAAKDHLATRTRDEFERAASKAALGKNAKARAIWLKEKADFRELMETLDETSAATRAEKSGRDESWEVVKVLIEGLFVLGRYAIPFLLGIGEEL